MAGKNKKKVPVEKVSSARESRRSFLNWLWGALGVVALLEFIALFFVFLGRGKTEPSAPDPRALVNCGPVGQYPPGSVTAFVSGRFYLVRLDDGGFLALSRQCTHLGCTVPWIEEEKRFVCPCHASSFDPTGAVIKAPAPRALDIYPLSIENQTITVDTGRPVKRSGFKREQAVFPKTP